jgi:LmbE family N-acetylglucosaminyl deacetylase
MRSPATVPHRLGRLHALARRGLFAAAVAVASLAHGRPPDPVTAADILQELRALRETATVLYVAAHPDDENTRLIAYLARGRGYRTAYVSLTRGDGGQNLIGTELGPGLGLIRTHELLAARRIDGGEQFFTRANDFGFSKDSRETLRIWDRDTVLEDMVRVIRTLRPDVIVTRFSPEPSGTHGHHTASAILAVEAFSLAADPAAFRATLGDLPPWQAKRVLLNVPRWGAAAGTVPDGLSLDVGGYNTLLGASFGEIAARSRTMHKSQGFGALGTRGTAWEAFRLLAGEPAAQDIMDGVDTTWKRVPGGESLGEAIDAVIAAFDPLRPATSVPALLALRDRLAALPDESIVAHKRAHLDSILVATLGLFSETTVRSSETVPGENLGLRFGTILRASPAPSATVRWIGTRLVGAGDAFLFRADRDLAADTPASGEANYALPLDTPLSTPHWLRRAGSVGMYAVEDDALASAVAPLDSPPVAIEHVFEISGRTLVVADSPVEVILDRVKGEIRRPLVVVPPVTITLVDDLAVLAPGASREVAVELTAARANRSGNLALAAPSGWTVSPSAHAFSFATPGESARFVFTVRAPDRAAESALLASVEIEGRTYAQSRVDIAYDHVPPLLIQPPASIRAVAMDLRIRERRVGYVPGAGDLVGDALSRMGFAVTPLAGSELSPERLQSFDTVVFGIRAFNTRSDLAPRLRDLFAWVEAGGTAIVQYNTTGDLKSATLAPHPLRLSRGRVTDESAAVRVLAPDHPALLGPNRIGPADFDGWVQERGLYFPDQWDARFTPLFAMHDEGEAPLEGSLLVARHGRGWFVYTGLSFFRQLPAGVPGAWRLFANLVSLGPEGNAP